MEGSDREALAQVIILVQLPPQHGLCAKVRNQDVAFFAIFCLSRSVMGRFRRDCTYRTIGNPGPLIAPEAVKQTPIEVESWQPRRVEIGDWELGTVNSND